LAESLLRNKINSEDSAYKVKAKLEKLKQKQARGDIVDFELVKRAIWSFANTSVIIDHIEMTLTCQKMSVECVFNGKEQTARYYLPQTQHDPSLSMDFQ
jgi:hypothetical protein